MKSLVSNVLRSSTPTVSSDNTLDNSHINAILRQSIPRAILGSTHLTPSCEMVSDSITGGFHYFDEHSHGAGGLILDAKVSSDVFLGHRMPLLPSFTDNKAVNRLSVTTDFPRNDTNQFRSYSNSPPPPALSPANSSPRPSAGQFNQTASPSPPIIVAEIGGQSSASSRATSEKGSNTGRAADYFLATSIPPRFKEIRNHAGKSLTVPEITPTSSSSPSSSSSTSSSALSDRVEYVANGLPILEKISIALGSPLRNLAESSHSTQHKDDKAMGKGSCIGSPIIPEVSTSVYEHFKDLSASLRPTVLADRLENVENLANVLKPQEQPLVSRRKSNARRRGGGQRRSRLKNRKVDSDSDFEVGGTRFGRMTRGRRLGPRVVDKHGPSRKSRLIKSNKSSDLPRPRASAETTFNRRYLESPFLCLCQSGGTVSSISQAVQRLHHHRYASSAQQDHTIASCSTDASVVATSHPAHIICPALQDLSCSQNGVNSLYAQSSIPSNCPLNTSARGANPLLVNPVMENSESRTLFSSLTYKPATQMKNRDNGSFDASSARVWLCAFCGKDNSFLELGSLYGPYWVAEAECAQLPTEMVAPKEFPFANGPSKPSDTNSNVERLSRRARSGVVTSAVTRSGATASQGQPTVSKTGALRLVIKARTNRTAQSATKPAADLFRIGPTGEVWFHLECVLWAPGTCIQGNGTVTGLGEALQLSLGTLCSHCDKPGAILSCCSRGCDLSYHYYCARLAGCKLNDEQYTIMCKKHQIYS